MPEIRANATAEPASHAGLHAQLLDRRARLIASGALARRDDVQALLREVDSALLRLERPDFGICEVCHDPIEADRLAHDPVTRVCLGCLSATEARALERDLEAAAAIQAGLLPPRGLAFDGWDIGFRHAPLGPVSGDHCDLLPASEPGVPPHFVLGDVSGKGVSASILMSQLHAIFRSLAPLGLELSDLVARGNRLFGAAAPSNAFATLVAGRLGPAGEVELVNAGHCEPLLLQGGAVRSFAPTGLPLGPFPEARYTTHRFHLDPGDVLLLYTDGLSEAENAVTEPYGPDRVAAALRASAAATAGDLLQACLDDLTRFRGAAAPSDDLTLLAVRREARRAS